MFPILIVSLYFFALIAEEGFLISPCYSSPMQTPTQSLIQVFQVVSARIPGSRLNLSTTDAWGQAVLCCGDHSVHHGTFRASRSHL